MAKKRKRFTAEFKKRATLDAPRGHHTIQAVAAKHQAHPSQVSTWKRQAVEGLKEVFEGRCSKREKDHESMIRDLHVKIGELTVERDFSRVAALSRSERRRMVERDGELSGR